MLAVDWLGLVLTAGVTALLLPGRYRLLRALAAMLIAEAGRLAVSLVSGSAIFSVTVAGALTRLQTDGPAHPLAQIAGLASGAAIALFFSRRIARDVLIYAAIAGGAILFFRGWGA